MEEKCKQRMLGKAGESHVICQNPQDEEFCDRKGIMRNHKVGQIYCEDLKNVHRSCLRGATLS